MPGGAPSRNFKYRLCSRAVSILARLVPQAYRERWVDEWKAELWYESERSPRSLKLVSRAGGAFADALSTRSIHRRHAKPPAPAGEGNVDMLAKDLKFALRSFMKRPGFTALTIVTLALGVGANTTIFSVVNAVLLRPLPYPEADRLVKVVGFKKDRGETGNLSPADFLDLEKDNEVFETTGAHGWVGFTTVTGDGEPERIAATSVTAGFLPTLGVTPTVGRVFTPAEDRPGEPAVAMISHGLWSRRFGSNPAIVGETVGLNLVPTTVIGVLPAEYRHPEPNPEREPEVYTLYHFDPVDAGRDGRFIRAIGRLASGLSVDEAQTNLSTIAARLEQEFPDSNTDEGVLVRPLMDAIVSDSRPALLLLLAAVGFVLLIACANISNLFLAAGAERRKELAIRTSLGARRGRLVRQMLTESLLLSFAGGALGLLVALWGTRFLNLLGAGSIPRAGEPTIDSAVLVFTMAVSAAAAVAFGLAPAFQLTRADSQRWLREGARGQSAGLSLLATRNLLIVTEVALSLMLLVGAGLLLQSFLRLQSVSPGFVPEKVIVMDVSLSTAGYEEGEQIPFYEELYERLAALPGVSGVGAINILPLSRNYSRDALQIDDRPAPIGRYPSAEARSVNPDYFGTMGIPLLRGRAFDRQDAQESPGVVIISESMARRFWANEDPIGKRITYNRGVPEEGRSEVGGTGSREIVGVVGDIKHLELDEETVPMFYTPQTQQPSYHTMTLVIRADFEPSTLATSVRHELWAMDEDVPLYRIRTMDELLAGSVAASRFRALLVGMFAGLALLLSLTGIYGVVGYLVRMRTHEIGIRVALGALKGDVRRMLVLQSLRPVALGIGVGLLGMTAVNRLLSGFLYGVTATDPGTYATVSGLVVAAALLATLLPAEKATRADPVQALRIE